MILLLLVLTCWLIVVCLPSNSLSRVLDSSTTPLFQLLNLLSPIRLIVIRICVVLPLFLLLVVAVVAVGLSLLVALSVNGASTTHMSLLLSLFGLFALLVLVNLVLSCLPRHILQILLVTIILVGASAAFAREGATSSWLATRWLFILLVVLEQFVKTLLHFNVCHIY